jgi:hypothetical protein
MDNNGIAQALVRDPCCAKEIAKTKSQRPAFITPPESRTMKYPEDTPFHRLLATKYDMAREDEAIEILDQHPELATLKWPGPDEQGQPFVKGSTALHYAANDGKVKLMARLIELGADVNASGAHWFRSVLSWSANNARIEAIQLLLESGADPKSLDALHAAAWGGSSSGKDEHKDYVAALKLLIDSGADMNDRRHFDNKTPLQTALDSGNQKAIDYLRSIGAES